MVNLSSPKVVIIDYGMGNLFSVRHACEQAGLRAIITGQKSELLNADAAILPGVGAFGDAMGNLQGMDLVSPIKDFTASGKPFLGICLGMQLLMTESEEFGCHKGLGVIGGSVVRFSILNKKNSRTKIPQVGWNQIYMPSNLDETSWDISPLKGLRNKEFMYFVHSYYVKPDLSETILSLTCYGDIEYCSSIKCKNIFASQFHPEKSAEKGIQIYKNWALSIQEQRSRLA